MGGIFLEKLFVRNFLEGILYLYRQDFVSMEKEGKFQSLEVREQAPWHLKTNALCTI